MAKYENKQAVTTYESEQTIVRCGIRLLAVESKAKADIKTACIGRFGAGDLVEEDGETIWLPR